MSLEDESSFARIIEEHLELKRRNSQLDPNMPTDRYREDPLEHQPLLQSEEQARLEDTLSGRESELDLGPSKVLAWPGEESEPEAPADPEDTLWGRARDFDWGDSAAARTLLPGPPGRRSAPAPTVPPRAVGRLPSFLLLGWKCSVTAR